MKKILLFSITIMIVFSACKKSDNSGTSGNLPAGSCRIISYERYMSTDTLKVTFEYDSDGKIVNESGDWASYLSNIHYTYNGHLCTSSYAGDDTTYYYYDGTGILTKYVIIDYITPSMPPVIRTHEFKFDAQTRVVLEEVYWLTNNITMKADSIVYIYTGGNVTQVLEYMMSGPGWYLVKFDFTFDSGKNYQKSIGRPPSSMYSWSENNVATTTIDNELVLVNQNTEYNTNGYPTSFSSTNFQIDTITSYYKLHYQCF